jgi:DNA helicase II / ATP-dependent DNA helicase PcrA
MEIRADFHIHSKYARATSKDMNILSIADFAKIKGLNVVATGDFTHPKWLAEIKDNLEECDGLLKMKKNDNGVRFILSTEISSIYKDKDKVRRVHNLILMPSIKSVEKLNEELRLRGCNLNSDGRPIIGLSSKNLLELVLEVDKNAVFIPAHIWTPWFSLFGSKSGYDTIEDCFEELTPFIKTMETGLSSDPEMNWKVSMLDNINLISNSDAHSPDNLGRECNILNCELNYSSIVDVIQGNDKKKFLYTVEFYPEEGRYHYDGHRNCDVCLSPEESEKYNKLCPVCNKPLVIGVANRVFELSDVKKVDVDKKTPFKYIIPLKQIISQILGVGTKSKKVCLYYDDVLSKMGSELDILLKKTKKEFEEHGFDVLGEKIEKMRSGKVKKIPGYDGVYGIIQVL